MLGSNVTSVLGSGVHGEQLYPSDTPSEQPASEHQVVRLNTLCPVLPLDLDEGVLAELWVLLLCTFSGPRYRLRNPWGLLKPRPFPLNHAPAMRDPGILCPDGLRPISSRVDQGTAGCRGHGILHPRTGVSTCVHLNLFLRQDGSAGGKLFSCHHIWAQNLEESKKFTFKPGRPGQYESVFVRVGD